MRSSTCWPPASIRISPPFSPDHPPACLRTSAPGPKCTTGRQVLEDASQRPMTVVASAGALTSSCHGLGKAARKKVACGDAPDPGLPQAVRKLRSGCRHLQPVSPGYIRHGVDNITSCCLSDGIRQYLDATPGRGGIGIGLDMVNAEDECTILHSPPPPQVVISLQQRKFIHSLCGRMCGPQGRSNGTL